MECESCIKETKNKYIYFIYMNDNLLPAGYIVHCSWDEESSMVTCCDYNRPLLIGCETRDTYKMVSKFQ